MFEAKFYVLIQHSFIVCVLVVLTTFRGIVPSKNMKASLPLSLPTSDIELQPIIQFSFLVKLCH